MCRSTVETYTFYEMFLVVPINRHATRSSMRNKPLLLIILHVFGNEKHTVALICN